MIHAKNALLLHLLVGCLLIGAARAAEPGPLVSKDGVVKVLIVGNSHTKSSELELAEMLSKLSVSRDAKTAIEATSRYASNSTLAGHWDRNLESVIAKGKFDLVIIQEHGGRQLDDPESTLKSVEKIHKAAKDAGSRLVWFMLHAPRKEQELIEKYESLATRIGSHFKITVAPVGLGWQRAIREHPTLVLHKKDGSHATAEGFYLNACVLYSTISGKSPVGLGDAGLKQLDPATREKLQKIAWETIQAKSTHGKSK